MYSTLLMPDTTVFHLNFVCAPGSIGNLLPLVVGHHWPNNTRPEDPSLRAVSRVPRPQFVGFKCCAAAYVDKH
jgi:hypothetical protein